MPNPPNIFVTGASGRLGMLVIDALLRTAPDASIIAGVRDPAKPAAADIQGKGVEVRIADYARPETLEKALAGVDRLLLISGSEIGQRKAQHRNVIAAAKNTGVSLIAYTSILHADTSPLLMAREHRDTEAALAEAGIPFVLLRNGWYTENFTMRLPAALATGTLEGAAEDGRIASAARTDYAEAAARVLAEGDSRGRIYELAGDTAFTLTELAAVAAEVSGKSVAYRNMTAEEFKAAALAAGAPATFAQLLADVDADAAEGALFDDSGTLGRLIGRPTTPLHATIQSFLQANG